MQHYEKATKETVFTYRGDSAGEVYLCGKFPDTLESRIPMRRYRNGWKASVPLPAGMYPYHFEVDGRHVPDGSGTVKVQQPFTTNGRWSLAIVPNWLSAKELAEA